MLRTMSSRWFLLMVLGWLAAAGNVQAQANAPKSAPAHSRLNLKCTADTGTFARYVPFGDQREVIVRRGTELGFNYGLEQSRRMVTVKGHQFPLVRSIAILSPPPMRKGQAPMSPQAAKNYQPESEVLYLPDAEVLIRREPSGFSSAEVEKILAAISLVE